MDQFGNVRATLWRCGLSEQEMNDEQTPPEQLLEFPCSFPIKTMGKDENGFQDTVIGIVEKHAGNLPESSIRTAPSRNGTFLSVTMTIEAQSQQQLDDIYRDLSDCEDVLVSL